MRSTGKDLFTVSKAGDAAKEITSRWSASHGWRVKWSRLFCCQFSKGRDDGGGRQRVFRVYGRRRGEKAPPFIMATEWRGIDKITEVAQARNRTGTYLRSQVLRRRSGNLSSSVCSCWMGCTAWRWSLAERARHMGHCIARAAVFS
jgi:hypothetical protein